MHLNDFAITIMFSKIHSHNKNNFFLKVLIISLDNLRSSTILVNIS